MEHILEVKQVYKNFGKKPVLKDVSFTIAPGSITGLLGPNGSGKTTIIKILNGLLRPNMGEVLIGGMPPGVKSKRLISYLPDTDYFNNWMRVKDLLRYFADFYSDFDIKKAQELLGRFSIQENARLKSLSKGTKEKVQLVIVMSRQAKLYILDEPIGGVDPAARDHILNTILHNYAPDSSILISTHLIQDVEDIFDHILFLSDGEIVLRGNVDEIRAEKEKSIDTLFREVFKC